MEHCSLPDGRSDSLNLKNISTPCSDLEREGLKLRRNNEKNIPMRSHGQYEQRM